jgi:hydroxymethylglutaryl-CoA lyase
MGYETGIDLAGLIEVSKGVQEIIGRELPGQVMKAGQWNRRYQVNAVDLRHSLMRGYSIKALIY